ncbi:DUF2071 domain-containing protein [Bacillus alkalicellulosilyticus]|uniref:DUF2071 domain-containing protein n=1 Tax=Alkalihalobacterium alkalicellulosilyticum TaxID=1912214 RepID=UPI000995EE64|nr:DUF2071 domain-containing protein [Bacillus alkalicellulosilyticus]
MKSIEGIIRRRILINYQVAPQLIEPILPSPFKPKIVKGKAIVGVCLIRLENIRPSVLSNLPLGVSSENAAHRVSVEWGVNGKNREGVYIFRRDTNALLNSLAGGRLFPGVNHYSNFNIHEVDDYISFQLNSKDREVEISLKGKDCENLPDTSVFTSFDDISTFFKNGADGYSPDRRKSCVQGMCLQTENWNMTPFLVEDLSLTYFQNKFGIPVDHMQFDSAVIMKNIDHKWEKISSIG